MRTSLLAYPRADRVLSLHASTLFLCDGDAVAAALLSYIEDVANADNLTREKASTNWHLYTYSELMLNLLIATKPALYKAIELLEKKNYISTDPPDEMKRDNEGGHWILLMAHIVNQDLSRLDDLIAERNFELSPKPKRRKPQVKPEIEPTDELDTILRFYNQARDEAAQKRGKRVLPIAGTQDRYKLMLDRLKQRPVAEICMAIAGCMLSDFHQGNNTEKKVYDSIELVLRDDKHIDQFITRALDAGVTLERVTDAVQRNSPVAVIPQAKHAQKLADYLFPYIVHCVYTEPMITRDVYVNSLIDAQKIIRRRIEAEQGIYTDTHENNFKFLIGVKNAKNYEAATRR